MGKFTPGPWIKDLSLSDHAYLYDKNGMAIFIIEYPHSKTDMILISKAPEMYEFIKEVKYALATVYDKETMMAKLVNDYYERADQLLKEIDDGTDIDKQSS